MYKENPVVLSGRLTRLCVTALEIKQREEANDVGGAHVDGPEEAFRTMADVLWEQRPQDVTIPRIREIGLHSDRRVVEWLSWGVGRLALQAQNISTAFRAWHEERPQTPT